MINRFREVCEHLISYKFTSVGLYVKLLFEQQWSTDLALTQSQLQLQLPNQNQQNIDKDNEQVIFFHDSELWLNLPIKGRQI